MPMLAIINGTLVTVSGPMIPNGTLILDQGKIVAVGKNLPIPAKAEVVDAAGKFVMPGIVEAHCHLGVMDFGVGEEDNHMDADGAPAGAGSFGPAVTPELMSYYAFNPRHVQLKQALEAGVTTILTRPGSGKIISGMGIIAKTFGKSRKDMVLMNPAEVKMALGENPKRNFGSKNQSPSTRMGSGALLRDAFLKAKSYMAKREKDPETPINYQLEPLVKVLKGELKARIHAHRADDIMMALRAADEFGFQLSIEHASEAHIIAEEVRKRNVPCVLGPSMTRTKVETTRKDFAAAGILEKAGVKVCITTDAGVVPQEYLRTCVALSHRAGMSEAGAIRAMTLTSAEIIGVENRVGSLDVGKDADVLILDGHPLELLSQVEKVYVNGVLAFDIERDLEDWEKEGN